MRALLIASLSCVALGVQADRPSSLMASDGSPTSLAAEAGDGLLVVVVMKGSWCRVCVGQLLDFGRLKKDFAALGARVVGLSPDVPADNRKAMLDHALPWPILSDPRAVTIKGWELWRADWSHPLPAIVVLDRCGQQRYRIEGRGPGDRPQVALMRALREINKRPARCGAPNV